MYSLQDRCSRAQVAESELKYVSIIIYSGLVCTVTASRTETSLIVAEATQKNALYLTSRNITLQYRQHMKVTEGYIESHLTAMLVYPYL